MMQIKDPRNRKGSSSTFSPLSPGERSHHDKTAFQSTQGPHTDPEFSDYFIFSMRPTNIQRAQPLQANR
jgi:hypothetical protein